MNEERPGAGRPTHEEGAPAARGAGERPAQPTLTAEDADALVTEAWLARGQAYAPYSNFLVGAAVLTGNGIVRGANVENASYGLSICAERVATVNAVTTGSRVIDAVAITSSAHAPTPPCGACRQFLHEFNPEMTVISEGSNGRRKQWRLSELLVDGFGPADLGVQPISEGGSERDRGDPVGDAFGSRDRP